MTTQAHIEAAAIPTALEKASRVNSAHLDQLERSLAMSLQSARHLASREEQPNVWDRKWQSQRDNIEKILDRTRSQVNELMAGLDSDVDGHLKRATRAWESIQCEGDLLQHALAEVRVQANELSAGDREHWTPWPPL